MKIYFELDTAIEKEKKLNLDCTNSEHDYLPLQDQEEERETHQGEEVRVVSWRNSTLVASTHLQHKINVDKM